MSVSLLEKIPDKSMADFMKDFRQQGMVFVSSFDNLPNRHVIASFEEWKQYKRY